MEKSFWEMCVSLRLVEMELVYGTICIVFVGRGWRAYKSVFDSVFIFLFMKVWTMHKICAQLWTEEKIHWWSQKDGWIHYRQSMSTWVWGNLWPKLDLLIWCKDQRHSAHWKHDRSSFQTQEVKTKQVNWEANDGPFFDNKAIIYVYCFPLVR